METFMKLFLFCCAVISAFMLQSCASTSQSQAKHLYECSEKVQEAIGKYEHKKYSSAQFILSDVIAKCPGHCSNDTAFFYLGKSWLGMKKPQDAKLEFERLIQSYANSPFNEEAHYLVGYSCFRSSSPWYLDQASTKDALRILNEFMESFPQSRFADSARACVDSCNEKLAKKEYEAGHFYEKVAQYESAIVYLKGVADAYPQSKLIPQVKLSMASDMILLNRSSEADAILDELLDQSKDPVILKKTRTLKIRVRKQL